MRPACWRVFATSETLLRCTLSICGRFLCERKRIPARQIARSQKPSRQPGLHGVRGITRRGLLSLGEQHLLMSDQRCAKIRAFSGKNSCLLIGLDVSPTYHRPKGSSCAPACKQEGRYGGFRGEVVALPQGILLRLGNSYQVMIYFIRGRTHTLKHSPFTHCQT